MARLIKGITVRIGIRQTIGVDGFNRTVHKETQETVEDVLVCPVSSTDVVDDLDLSGKRAIYELCIPKGDQHDWVDTTVYFYGKAWRTIGYPQEWIEANVPLRWNRKVKVEAYG